MREAVRESGPRKLFDNPGGDGFLERRASSGILRRFGENIQIEARTCDRPDLEESLQIDDEQPRPAAPRPHKTFLRGDDSGGFGPNASSRDDFDIPTVLRRQMD